MTPQAPRFLFLLSPPLSGSTLIKELVEASPHVSSFATEGQFLPRLRHVLGTPRRWDPELVIDWAEVKRVFYANWDLTCPILFDKSPPHLVRAPQLAHHFQPCQFLITIRNPFAQIEGLLRRGWYQSATRAAEFWLDCARWQTRNLENFPSALFFTYEALCAKPDAILADISALLPELGPLSIPRKLYAHNATGKPLNRITNLNDQKIRQLSADQVKEISRVLQTDSILLDAFGYSPYPPAN